MGTLNARDRRKFRLPAIQSPTQFQLGHLLSHKTSLVPLAVLGAKPLSTGGHPDCSPGPRGCPRPGSIDNHISLITKGYFKWECAHHAQLLGVFCAHNPWDQPCLCCSCGTHLSGCCPRSGIAGQQGSGSGRYQGDIHAQEIKPVGGGENGAQEWS